MQWARILAYITGTGGIDKRIRRSRSAKEVEYWGLVAIIGPRPAKIRVILRRIGDGKIVFWSGLLPKSEPVRWLEVFTDGDEGRRPSRRRINASDGAWQSLA